MIMVKPDAVRAARIGSVLDRFERGGLRIVAARMLCLTPAQAREFYAVHRERPFFESLVKFMTSGPIVAAVLEGEDAVRRAREIMGATDPARAEEGTIRRDFGSNVEQNAVHGSDGPETAREEISFFFSVLEQVGGN